MTTFKPMLFIVLGVLSLSVNAQVFDVPYKDHDPTRTLLIPTKNPKAVVLLFPGGGGFLRLKSDGSTKNQHTFVRSKDMWAQYGIDAVLVDSPYHLGDGRGHLRSRKEHKERIFNVVKYYKEKLNMPVWIFGHSMGSVSIGEFVNGGQVQRELINGAIIAGTFRTVSVDDDVQFPILAIHHLKDECDGTQIHTSKDIINNRPKEKISQFIGIEGGVSTGYACGSMAYHGFNETEAEFIKAAAEFILKN